jgi:large subunit ribosomal protein L23
MDEMQEIIKRPVITEKAMKLGGLGQYVFEVATDSNKIEIKKALETMFEVEVKSVRTVRQKGKQKSRMTKRGYIRGNTALKKKAYITLKEGHSIDLVDTGSQGE